MTTRQIIDWFEALNPYRKSGSILKLEDINCGIKSDKREPLYCFAISAKRYALFNVDSRGKPILRKASAHGLGHLIDPYSDEQAPPDLPKPRVPLAEIGVHRWHHDFWLKIIQATIDGHPNQVVRDWHSALSRPAAMRYSASNPHLLAWLDSWNAGKPYEEQVRPFGFLLSYTALTGSFAPFHDKLVTAAPTRGRPRKNQLPKPIAPFSRDPTKALQTVFDRVTGDSIGADQLKSYSEVLAQYHLSCEDKFLNGHFLERGRTERRHVVAIGLTLIGKEANRVGESGEVDPTVKTIEISMRQVPEHVRCGGPLPRPM